MSLEMISMLAIGFICGVCFGSLGQHYKYVDGYMRGIEDGKKIINGGKEEEKGKL